MTVQKIALGVHRYTGLTADSKPTSVPPGSTYLDTQTQALYITYDGTNWVLKDATGEVQASPTSNTQLDRLKALLTGIVLATGTNVIGKARLVTATGDEVTNDTADAIKSMPQRFDMILKPFGKGSLTTDGVQYSAEVGSIGDTYTAIEAITINQPLGYTLEEIEFALTVAIKSSSTAESVLWKMQASDNGTDWQDLIAEQTRAASAAAYADVTALGRFAPTTNFLGTSATFQVRAVAKSGAAGGETATGKMKNSSYLICKYRRS